MHRHLVTIVFVLAGAWLLQPIFDRVGAPPSARYAAALQRAGLGDEALGRQWFRARARVFDAATTIDEAGYREEGFFGAARPRAEGFSLSLRRGQVLRVRLERLDGSDGRLFADLLRRREGRWEQVASVPTDGRVLVEHADNDTTYRLRLQPELLVSINYRLTLASGGTLPHPVAGYSRDAIGSAFGAPRDGGARRHEGVDIFAPRGTPVRAVSDGRVRTDRTRLGGNVVWLRTLEGDRYYYAHLASVAIRSGAFVRQGDTLGAVGNTGNARATPTHLHFGVYTHTAGAVDPEPYLRPPPQESFADPPMHALGMAHRVTASALNLRAGPDRRAPSIAILPEHGLVRPAAATAQWLRVRLADGRHGFVAARWVTPAREPVAEIASRRARLLSAPALDAWALKASTPAGALQVLGRLSGFLYVRDGAGDFGWHVEPPG